MYKVYRLNLDDEKKPSKCVWSYIVFCDKTAKKDLHGSDIFDTIEDAILSDFERNNPHTGETNV